MIAPPPSTQGASMTDNRNNHFIPPGFDPSDFVHIEPLGAALLRREIGSAGELRQWVLDVSRLFELIYEHSARKQVDHACHTDDKEKEDAYLHWVRQVEPKINPLLFNLQQKYLASPHRDQLADDGFSMMSRDWQADVDIFRQENVPLATEVTELSKDYGKLTGAMVVTYQGREQTLQQLATFQEQTDRDLRRETWQLAVDRRLQDREALDDVFDKLLDLRRRIAENAGFDSFRSYIWKSMKRFDYAPEDCHAFGDAVESLCVPMVEQLDCDRRRDLGVDTLRPWDLSVDPLGRPPLHPFDPDEIDGFVEATSSVFERISPNLATQFKTLRDHGDLDLDSRPGKRPGGFLASFEASKRPFIFMNAAGTHRDVTTLLHEGGHAFHYLASCGEPNLFVRQAPLEFCEVASMSMELLAFDHLDVFYRSSEDGARAVYQQLEGILRGLPWIATIDGFQHWLYNHPGHGRRQRTDAWLGLLDRFSSSQVDWTGHEKAREAMWQRQLHLFSFPFYYIEYGIAQLGALQVWLNYRREPEQAMRRLRAAFELGGTRPLPKLFEVAGLEFDFSQSTIQPLMDQLAEALNQPA
jgi:oligoendopeptidase F